MLEDQELYAAAEIEQYKHAIIDARHVWLDELLAAHATRHIRLQGEVIWCKDISAWVNEHADDLQNLFDFASEYDIEQNHVQVQVGPPQKVISRIANDLKAELVVLGSSGKRGLLGRLLGGTVEQTMHVLRTDVLSVRP